MQKLHKDIRDTFIHTNDSPFLAKAQTLLLEVTQGEYAFAGHLMLLRLYTRLEEVEKVTRMAQILLNTFKWVIEWREDQDLALIVDVEKDGKAGEVAVETWIHLWRAYASREDLRECADIARGHAEGAFRRWSVTGEGFRKLWPVLMEEPFFERQDLAEALEEARNA